MLFEHDKRRPRIARSAYIAPTAVIVGDVEIGDEACIMFGAVVSAESGPVTIGRRCIVMENAVIRGTRHHPVRVEDEVLIGPGAHLSGCSVGRGSFIATGASVFNGATLEPGAEIRINGVLHVNSRLRTDETIPIGWVGVGDPAQILPPNAHDEISKIQRTLNFTATVFGLSRDTPQSEVAARYTARLTRHRDDIRLPDEPPEMSRD